MIIPESCDYNYDLELSTDEKEVINKFLSSYRGKEFIVADEYRQDFSTVPLEEEKIIFKINDDTWKCVDFCKRIIHNGKPYIVELGLWRVSNIETKPKCLQIHEFRIIFEKKVHFITLDTNDVIKKNILFNILSIFDERKIISPEQEYCKQMYTNKVLQDFIKNHEWQNIEKGIEQNPNLANALFVIKEGFTSTCHYTADFGTILYQLISFRINNIDNFDEKDLLKLDELILKLSKTNLLKVQLHESTGIDSSWPTSSILLEKNYYSSRMHTSKQYTVDNTELLQEKTDLDNCVKKLTK